MRNFIGICLAILLSACGTPNFVGDARPVPVVSETPDRFVLPARFAFARLVYGRVQVASAEETDLWAGIFTRARGIGSFTPIITPETTPVYASSANLVEAARAQRYNYLLLIRIDPATGSADIVLFHVGSGGVMATAQAVSPEGGQYGFFGGEILSQRRLNRATLRIAEATAPILEELLDGVARRQN